MIKKTALAFALLAFSAVPALASHCPLDAKAIEAALAKSSLSDAKKAEIAALKDEGMALHKAGNHHDSEATLAKAMRMLLLEN